MLSRNELIKALIKGLKLDDNIFNYELVNEEVAQIQENKFMDFYKAVMSADTFGNGLKAIIQVAETFKPKQDENAIDLEAQRLIQLVYGMNQAVYQDHIKTGISFDVLLSGVKFPKLSSEDNSVLTNVAPHYNLRDLIQHISCYTNSIEQHRAFKTALTRVGESLAIENSRVSGMIGRMKK